MQIGCGTRLQRFLCGGVVATAALHQWCVKNPCPGNTGFSVTPDGRAKRWQGGALCIGMKSVHPSHDMLRFETPMPGFWVCAVCGFYSSAKAHNLALLCTGHQTSHADHLLRRLSSGLLPYEVARRVASAHSGFLGHRQCELVRLSNNPDVALSGHAPASTRSGMSSAQLRLQALRERVRARL